MWFQFTTLLVVVCTALLAVAEGWCQLRRDFLAMVSGDAPRAKSVSHDRNQVLSSLEMLRALTRGEHGNGQACSLQRHNSQAVRLLTCCATPPCLQSNSTFIIIYFTYAASCAAWAFVQAWSEKPPAAASAKDAGLAWLAACC